MSPSFILPPSQLSKIIPNNQHIDEWYSVLCGNLPDRGINTPRRVAAFLAQTTHESNNFELITENLNYRAEGLMKTWPRQFPTLDIANKYAHKPELIANRVYANRMGNGNEASGDGWAFCGRGLIQLTGREIYQKFADSIKMDIKDLSEYLVTFQGCVKSSVWFFDIHNLNHYSDIEDIKTQTEKINGGLIGLDDRISRFESFLKILGE